MPGFVVFCAANTAASVTTKSESGLRQRKGPQLHAVGRPGIRQVLIELLRIQPVERLCCCVHRSKLAGAKPWPVSQGRFLLKR
jgi:hypothetical protein